MIQQIAFVIVALIAFGLAFFRVKDLLKLMKSHNGRYSFPTDIIPRLTRTLLDVFSQRAVLKKPIIGTIHATIFWGFIIISFGTLEQFLGTLVPGFNFGFLGNPIYLIFLFTHDLFTLLVLIAVGAAVFRRAFAAPKYLGLSSDANLILFFTGLLMVSIFLMHGFLILGTQFHYSHREALFASFEISKFLSNLDFSGSEFEALGISFKWVHMILVLGFAVYIPGSKHLHVLAAGPNTFLKPAKTEKPMTSIDFEDESVEQYGAGKITDLSWKDALDYYSCTECGRCQEVCPAWNSEKPLSPKKLIVALKENLYANKSVIFSGKTDEITHVVDEVNTEDVFWACTSCRACEVACPVFIQHTDKIYDVRRNLVMMEARFPLEVQTVFKNMETNGSPWAFSSDERINWADGIDIPLISSEPDPDYLFWIGCAGAFDDRNKKVVRSFAQILKKANVKFAVLGTEETCTGDAARRIGNEYLYQILAKTNVETLNRYAIKKIVTTCPHCFNTIKNEYPEFGGNYEVLHHTQLIGDLISTGKIKPRKTDFGGTVTYHDSCYLGRWNGIYDEPRNLLAAVSVGPVVEMEQNREKSMCCGAGGGRMWMEETLGSRININRTEQAKDTGASLVASACPFCITMVGDGIKAKDYSNSLVVKDIAELINDATN